jgi:hypothetical protein
MVLGVISNGSANYWGQAPFALRIRMIKKIRGDFSGFHNRKYKASVDVIERHRVCDTGDDLEASPHC